MSKTVPFESVAEKWKENPDYREAYKTLESEFEVARELIHARVRARLTQQDLAKRMGTTQSAIARLESGTKSINLKTLEKYAAATGNHLHVRLSAH